MLACQRALDASLEADPSDLERLKLGLEASQMLMMLTDPYMVPPPPPPSLYPPHPSPVGPFLSAGVQIGQQEGRDAPRPRSFEESEFGGAAFDPVQPMTTTDGPPWWPPYETTVDIGFRVADGWDKDAIMAAAEAAVAAFQQHGVGIEKGAVQYLNLDGTTTQVGINVNGGDHH